MRSEEEIRRRLKEVREEIAKAGNSYIAMCSVVNEMVEEKVLRWVLEEDDREKVEDE